MYTNISAIAIVSVVIKGLMCSENWNMKDLQMNQNRVAD